MWRLRKRAILAVENMPADDNNDIRATQLKVIKRDSMHHDGQFAVLGLLFSVFREITICWRKVNN